jgi:hypothetical protein
MAIHLGIFALTGQSNCVIIRVSVVRTFAASLFYDAAVTVLRLVKLLVCISKYSTNGPAC